MILSIFSVKDHKAAAFGRPFMTTHAGVAIRSFADQVNDAADKTNIYNSHPDDFTLYELGKWDDETASYDLYPQPKHLVDGSAVRNTHGDFEAPRPQLINSASR